MTPLIPGRDPKAWFFLGAFLGALLLAACSGTTAPPEAPPEAAPLPPPAEDASAADAPGDEALAPPADVVDGSQEQAQTIVEPANDQPAKEIEAASPTVEALIYLEPQRVRQGGAFLLAIDAADASAASVAFNGQFLSLIREGDRFFTVLPVDAQTPPGPLSFVVAVADGNGNVALRQDLEIVVEDAAWRIESLDIDENTARLLAPEVGEEDRAVRANVQRSRTPERLWRDFFRPPTAGAITSEFGVLRSYNGSDPIDYHSGLDFGGARGAVVVAPNTAVVAWTGETERRGLGIMLDHGGGLFTSYWHLSAIDVEPGAKVNRGDAIARIGSSGLSTGPHLHWEVVVHGVPVDPLQWLRELEVPDPGAAFDPADAVNATAEPAASSAPSN
ncbi:MAG: M23 family metallopeptidase [Dehalococcoidia bacterium]